MSLPAEERSFDIVLSDNSSGPGGSCTFKPMTFPLLVPRATKRIPFPLYWPQHSTMRIS